jgi:hypothetical protein
LLVGEVVDQDSKISIDLRQEISASRRPSKARALPRLGSEILVEPPDPETKHIIDPVE